MIYYVFTISVPPPPKKKKNNNNFYATASTEL